MRTSTADGFDCKNRRVCLRWLCCWSKTPVEQRGRLNFKLLYCDRFWFPWNFHTSSCMLARALESLSMQQNPYLLPMWWLKFCRFHRLCGFRDRKIVNLSWNCTQTIKGAENNCFIAFFPLFKTFQLGNVFPHLAPAPLAFNTAEHSFPFTKLNHIAMQKLRFGV